MVVRVKLVNGEFRLVLPAEALTEFHVKEGDPFEVTPLGAEPRIVGVEEALAAFHRFEAEHRETFIELAK